MCEDLENVDEEIAKYCDDVVLCTDEYRVYDGIEGNEGINDHFSVDHSDGYVVGDVHVNGCENRHSFVREWLGKFRGVSKCYLQGYLDFLALKLNSANSWFKKLLCYNLSR